MFQNKSPVKKTSYCLVSAFNLKQIQKVCINGVRYEISQRERFRSRDERLVDDEFIVM